MKRIKLTNKQIDAQIKLIRERLKHSKSDARTLSISIDMSIKDAEKATVIYSEVAYRKMMALVNECSKEVGWHGTVERINKTTFRIVDIVVFPQTVTAATVTTDDEAYPTWLYSQTDDVFNNLRFHGHSHVNMGVTPSGTDTTYQNDMLANVTDYYIFAIWNKKEANWMLIYDVENNIIYEDADITIEIEGVTEYTDWAKEMQAEYVMTYTPVKKDKDKKDQKTPGEQMTLSQYRGNAYYANDDAFTGDYFDRYYGGYYGQK